MKKEYTKYLLALLLFGSNGIVASHIALNSYEIVLLRTFIGSIFLLLIFRFTGNQFTFYKPKLRKSFLFLLLSGAAMGLSWMFLYEAYQQIGVSIASLCYYCGPVSVMILSPLLFNEHFTFRKVICFLLVFVGVCLINSQAVSEGSHPFGIFC